MDVSLCFTCICNSYQTCWISTIENVVRIFEKAYFRHLVLLFIFFTECCFDTRAWFRCHSLLKAEGFITLWKRSPSARWLLCVSQDTVAQLSPVFMLPFFIGHSSNHIIFQFVHIHSTHTHTHPYSLLYTHRAACGMSAKCFNDLMENVGRSLLCWWLNKFKSMRRLWQWLSVPRREGPLAAAGSNDWMKAEKKKENVRAEVEDEKQEGNYTTGTGWYERREGQEAFRARVQPCAFNVGANWKDSS